MSKKILIFVVLLIILAGVLWFYTNMFSNTNSPLAENVIPTSTSAPTPTSIYKRSIREVPSTAAATITLTNSSFSPSILRIKAGDTVTWINNSGTQATVNSNPHPTHTDYPPLNLGEFNDGDNLQLRFPKPGRYGYHNHFDATQTGTIIVE